jgi:hypothetical protein
MRLVTDNSHGAYAVRVSCYCCGITARLADMRSDLDGPAFQAYYCVKCATELCAEERQVQRHRLARCICGAQGPIKCVCEPCEA